MKTAPALIVITCLTLTAQALLASEPEGALDATPDTQPSVYVMPPHLVGLPQALAETLLAASAQAIQDEGLQVLTQTDAQDLLANQTDLQQLGADGNGTALAALGRAVGAQYLLAMTASPAGEDTVLHLRLIESASSKVLSRRELRVADYGGDLNEAVKTGARMTVAPVFAHLKGTLDLSISEEGANVLVDGEQLGVSPIDKRPINGGTHLLTVTKEGFIRHQETFKVGDGEVIAREILLRPSPEFAKDYRSRNGLLRTLAWVTTGSALLLGAGTGAVGYFFRKQNAMTTQSYDEYQALKVSHPQEALDRKEEYEKRIANSQNATRFLGVSVVIVGVVAGLSALGAVTFWLVGEDPDRYAEFEGGVE